MLKFAQLATSVKSRYRAADAVTVVAASEQQERTLPGGQGCRSTYTVFQSLEWLGAAPISSASSSCQHAMRNFR